jgi:hypothetical protein
VPAYRVRRITTARLQELLAAGVGGTFYAGYFVVGFEAFGGGTAYVVTR